MKNLEISQQECKNEYAIKLLIDLVFEAQEQEEYLNNKAFSELAIKIEIIKEIFVNL